MLIDKSSVEKQTENYLAPDLWITAYIFDFLAEEPSDICKEVQHVCLKHLQDH